MSRVWSMMDVGKRSMMNSQTALQTVGHNIANKSTEGYSRQRVDLVTNEPTGMGKLRIGNGARATSVTRINNPFIEKQIERERNGLGRKEAEAQSMMRVEQVFNEQDNKGLNKYVGDFFNAFRELSNSPESLAIRSLVKESGQFLANDFKRVSTQLTKIQDEIDFQMSVHVSEINEITREISQLNEKIQTVEMNSLEANDERDRRDLLIKKLGEKLDIKYGESDDGLVTITAANSAILVSGGSQRDLNVAPGPARPGKKDGNFEIYYKATENGTPMNITRQVKGGALGGLIETRDGYINDTLSKVDELAYTLSREINDAHTNGFDGYNRQGVAFFKPLNGKEGAAANLEVNTSVTLDPGKVVAASGPGGPGDNRVANLISAMQYKQFMSDGTHTFDDFYNNIVGNVGVSANKANSELEAQKGIVAQLNNIRESISGVSLDEETTKMIEYQKAYDASAKLIKTADEMLDTVLALKR
jgi:flagellar hook-associated protein 1